MSSVGDAFSGSTSGATDTTGFGDTPNLTNSDFSGLTDADIMGGGGGFGSSDFNSLNNFVSALSGGGITGSSPIAAQSAAMTSPSAAASTGGDPTGAASGTQSATSPGTAPASSSQQGGGGGGGQGQQPQSDQFAPTSAVQELNKLLKSLQGKPAGPTGTVQARSPAPFALPTIAAGQTGPQSPGSFSGTPAQPLTAARTPADNPPPTPPPAGTEPGGSRDIRAGLPSGSGPWPVNDGRKAVEGTPQTDIDGNPVTAAGTPAADTPLPPPRPAEAPAQTADAGRDITVRQKGGAAQPSTTGGKPTPKTDDQGRPITVGLPTKTPLPTHKGGPEPAPERQPPPPRLLQDITGRSTGVPTELAELAHAAMALAPLIGMFMGRGRRGHFRGGRFTHGVGGFHPPSHGPWPYHHPGMGWDMHHMHPGGGWRPMHPRHAEQMGLLDGGGGGFGGGQNGQDPNQQDPNAPDPNRPPKETGADPGPATDTASGAIPGVSGKQVDDYTRQVAQKYNIDPNVASRILAQESGYGQARRPGDNGTSFGPFQLHFAPDGHAMGDDFRRDTGKDPRDPSTWKDQIDYAMMRAAKGGWGPWTTTMNKLGLNEWSGINRTFAGQPMSKQQPTWSSKPGIPPNTLPVTSQPMVAG